MPVEEKWYDGLINWLENYEYTGGNIFRTKNKWGFYLDERDTNGCIKVETVQCSPRVQSYSVDNNGVPKYSIIKNEKAQSAVINFPPDFDKTENIVVLKYAGSGGAGVDDNLYFKAAMNDSSSGNALYSLGNSKDTYGLELVKETLGDNYPPSRFDIRCFSLSGPSGPFTQGCFINEQLLLGNEIPSQAAVICDPAAKSQEYNGHIFNNSSQEYEAAIESLTSSGELETFITLVNEGYDDVSLKKIYPDLGVSSPAELSTYYAYKQNQPTISIFTASSGVSDSYGGAWMEKRDDFKVLGQCSGEMVVFEFGASSEPYELSDGRKLTEFNHQDVNQYVDDLLKDGGCILTEEQFKTIISTDGFVKMGVYNKDTGMYDTFVQEDFFDENGQLNLDFFDEFYEKTYGSSISENVTDTVSIDYDFVNSNIEKLVNLFKRCDILSIMPNLLLETGGMMTFAVANDYFNNYVSTSKSFLLELNRTYGSILQIADSMQKLDVSLAETLNLDSYIKNLPSFNYLMNIDLNSISEFYNAPVDMSSLYFDSDGSCKITTDMLLDVISDRHIMRASLLEDIRDSEMLKRNLDDFINSSKSELSGPALELVIAKLEEYSIICEDKKNYAQSLMDTMYEAFMELLNYMGDYNMLDTSMIPEVESRIETIDAAIESLEKQIAQLISTDGMLVDTDGDNESDTQIDNTVAIAQAQAQLDLLEETSKELGDLLDKLVGLKPKDEIAASNISGLPVASSAIDLD